MISQQKLYKPEGNGTIYLNWWKENIYNQEHSTQQDSDSDLTGKAKAFQIKVKRIHHHQTSFTTNSKETSLGRKLKRRKRLTENKPQTIKKTVIGSYILIITLIANGLNVPTKRHRLATDYENW